MGSGSLAFIAGSSLGFVGASVHYYQLSLRQALLALQRYPRCESTYPPTYLATELPGGKMKIVNMGKFPVLQLHLEHNFPCEGYDRLEGPQLAPEYWRRGLARQGNLIAAWHSASGTLEDIHDARVQLMAENIAKGGGGASKSGA